MIAKNVWTKTASQRRNSMKLKKREKITPNPNHCPPSRLVKIKELDVLKHLVRKYPDVTLDMLLLKDLCQEACKRGVAIVYSRGMELQRWEFFDD